MVSAVIVGITVCALVACGSPLSVSQLEAVPETYLYYPGSTVVDKHATPQVAPGIDAPGVDGFVDTDLRSTASFSDIASWYQQQLGSRGWTSRGMSPSHQFEGYTLPPAFVFTRGRTEEFYVGYDPVQKTYYTTYKALVDTCVSVSPAPLNELSC